ncbi:hypothetical protein HDV57DRAFT_437168 [Trichoderma longibrachiatum]|uniref:Uncharacterized protein n=1 Tax=Trichoderma longibrachiatum ATCC 18648 TaxID=983965 RepID=A0A2T4CFR1_TRILO|nr:hypothetical protein M440DRAFT_16607 [Trichoderma longibrachiatum ATCC 18648]
MAQFPRSVSLVNLETESISGCSNTTYATSDMRLRNNVRTLYERMQQALRHGRRKQRRGLEISSPFGLKKEPVLLPGISQEELSILREKAAASQIGVAEDSMYPDPTSSLPRSLRSRSPYRSPSPFSIASAKEQQAN